MTVTTGTLVMNPSRVALRQRRNAEKKENEQKPSTQFSIHGGTTDAVVIKELVN
tara:strand:- start:1066 stop:1227 length:162 start_codon:yes stop_codon:yes gene_type:complete